MAISTRFDYVVAPKVAICCMSKAHSSSALLEHAPLAPLDFTKRAGVQPAPATYNALATAAPDGGDVELHAPQQQQRRSS